MDTYFTAATLPIAIRVPGPIRLFRLATTSYHFCRRLPALRIVATTYTAPRRLGQALSLVFIIGFVLLTWVRAESLTRMMPHLVDLGLGVLAGIIGNSLGYWFGLLGVAPAPACTVFS